jgi:hypothetical protein
VVVCIICNLSLPGTVRAQAGTPEAVTIRSYSGQFVIQAEIGKLLDDMNASIAEADKFINTLP